MELREQIEQEIGKILQAEYGYASLYAIDSILENPNIKEALSLLELKKQGKLRKIVTIEPDPWGIFSGEPDIPDGYERVETL